MIQSDKSFTDNAKVRAKRRWCSIQERLNEIQGYLKCMKRMPVNATSVKVPSSSSSLNLVEGVALVEMLKGLGGYVDRTLAYHTAWKRFEQIFGDRTLLSQRFKDELLDGPATELYDAASLATLRD